MKFAHFILRKVVKFVATKCLLLRLKCTKFNFGCWEHYSAPQTWLDLRGLLLMEGRGKGWKWESGRERAQRWRKWEKREEDGSPSVGSHPMSEILKNTLIAELIWLAGAATQTFAPRQTPSQGATENAGVENAIRSKLQWWKMQEWKKQE